MKSRLLLIFARFGVVKDIVIYNDDITGEWFTSKGYVYLEIPRDLGASFETLTHCIKLNSSDTSVLATWDRMPDFCRCCKAIGHIKDNCDKRPADSRTYFICRQKGHMSYQCTRSQDYEPQPHKHPRNREPASTLSSRHIATPKIKKGPKTNSLLDLTFGPTAMPPAHDIQSSTAISSSNVENTKNTPAPNEGLVKPVTVYTLPSEEPGSNSDIMLSFGPDSSSSHLIDVQVSPQVSHLCSLYLFHHSKRYDHDRTGRHRFWQVSGKFTRRDPRPTISIRDRGLKPPSSVVFLRSFN